MSWWVLIALLLTPLSALNFTGKFVEYTPNTTFLEFIYLPKREEFRMNGIVFPTRHIYKSPIHMIVNVGGMSELCNSSKTLLETNYPNLWRNVPNSCERYFCSANPPLPYTKMMNSSLSKELVEEAKDHHILAHRFCLQCFISMQNFTNTSCPWILKDYFDDSCDARGTYGPSIPIWFESRLSICYDPIGNVFLARNDFTHHSLLPFYLYWNSLVLILMYLILLMYTIVFVVIPYATTAIRIYRNAYMASKMEQISIFFNFFHFYIFFVIASFVQSILLNSFDVISIFVYFPGRFRNISTPLSVVCTLCIFVLLVLQWLSIYVQSQRFSQTFYNRKTLCLMTVPIWIGLCWALLGACLYIAYATTDMISVLVALGVWTMVTAAAFALIGLLLLVAAIFILKTFLALDVTVLSPTELTLKLLGIKFTKVIFVTLCLMAGNVTLLSFYGLQMSVGLDLLSFEFNFVEYAIISFWIVIVHVFVLIFLTNFDHIERAYTCCCCCRKNGERYE